MQLSSQCCHLGPCGLGTVHVMVFMGVVLWLASSWQHSLHWTRWGCAQAIAFFWAVSTGSDLC